MTATLLAPIFTKMKFAPPGIRIKVDGYDAKIGLAYFILLQAISSARQLLSKLNVQQEIENDSDGGEEDENIQAMHRSPPKKRVKSDDPFAYLQDEDTKSSSDVSNDDIEQRFNKELEKYTSMCDKPSDLSQFWSENSHLFPILSKIAYAVLSIPPTSCSCERTFSQLKHLLSDIRQNIDREYLCKLMIAKDFAC